MLLAKLAGELTVLPTRLYIAKETVLSEISYGSHLAAVKIDKAASKIKSKDFKIQLPKFKKKEKVQAEEVKAEPVQETVVEETVSDTTTESVSEEPVVEIVTESGFSYSSETQVPMMNIPVEDPEPMAEPMDYSKYVRGVTYDEPLVVPKKEEDDLKPVTQEDCDKALKKIKANQVK